MEKVQFNLVDYTMDIQKIAEANKCSKEEALGKFIANLATMKEHYKGASHLNFHALGQLWNSLPGEERNTQKSEVRNRLLRVSRGGSSV